jgi:hypothetical protein
MEYKGKGWRKEEGGGLGFVADIPTGCWHRSVWRDLGGTINDKTNKSVELLASEEVSIFSDQGLLICSDGVVKWTWWLMEAIRSSETSVLTKARRRHIPEDGILHSHRRENLKSYIALTGWTL